MIRLELILSVPETPVLPLHHISVKSSEGELRYLDLANMSRLFYP